MLQQNEIVPKHLRKRAGAYEASRRRFEKRSKKKRPSYMAMRARFEDHTLSFEDLKEDLHVTTRERVRQIADEFFSDVRDPAFRRSRTGKNCERLRLMRRRAALRRAGRKFRKLSRIYRPLRAHCKNADLRMRHVWNEHGPSERSYKIAGKSTYVLRITAAHGSGESLRLYAKTRDIDRRKLRAHEQLAVVVEVDDPLKVHELYIIPVRTFLAAKMSYVLIPINGRHGIGGPAARIQWSRYRVSSIQ